MSSREVALFDGAMEEFVGRPEGPPKFIEAFGMEVGTFIDPRHDLNKSRTQWGVMMYHVPVKFRGPYKESFNGEEMDSAGWALCLGVKQNGEDCNLRAQNRSGYCANHGGQLHPLDKRKFDWSKASRETLWKNGRLPVEELTDEELARGTIRRDDGTWVDTKRVPREVYDKAVRELFKRSDEKLQQSLLDCVDSIVEIAQGTAYEPADRLKAATWVFERLRGKTPTEIKVTQEAPWQVVMDGMVGGSREESRKRRGVIDAEVVEDVESPGYESLAAATIAEAGDPVPSEFLDEEMPYDEGSADADDRGPVARVAGNAPQADEPDDPGDYAEAHPEPEPVSRPKRPSPEEIAEQRQRIRDEIERAKRARYASVAKGFSDVEPVPYEVEATQKKSGHIVVRFVEPKLKPAPKKRRRNDWEQ